MNCFRRLTLHAATGWTDTSIRRLRNVYVAAFVTVIEVEVAPLLHNKVPVKLLAVNNELPQLFVTVTVGADGIAFGAEAPLPLALVQPFADWVTV
jgi:hypothetical protein